MEGGSSPPAPLNEPSPPASLMGAANEEPILQIGGVVVEDAKLEGKPIKLWEFWN